MSTMDFQIHNDPIPFVKNEQEGLSTYLCFLSGDQVASLYEQFGPKLFARAARGVQSGRGFGWRRRIGETIAENPSLFQAFNKGIVLVASDVELSAQNGHPSGLVKLSDISVIDGAQTIGALFYSQKLRHVDISKVVVPVKVLCGRYIGRNALFLADASIRLNTSDRSRPFIDLYGASPFAQSLSAVSLSTPSPTNGTFWFLETSHGAFEEFRRYRSIGSCRQQREIRLRFPLDQKIDLKTMSTIILSWDGRPQLCMRGSILSCRDYFREIDCEQPASELFFKELVSRVILFHSFQRIKRSLSQVYLPSGFLFSCMAYLNFASCNRLNLLAIWERQGTTLELDEALNSIVSIVRERITADERSSSMRAMNVWLRSEEKQRGLLSSPIPRALQEALRPFLRTD